MAQIRVLVVDERDLVRSGICALLQGSPDIDVVADRRPTELSAAQVDRVAAHVVLIGVDAYHDHHTLEQTASLMQATPTARVVLVSESPPAVAESEVALTGAAAYAPKDVAADALRDLVRRVAAGDELFSADRRNEALRRLTE